MRVLATIGFSFSTGVFLAALLPWDGWQLYAAAGAALLALVWLLAARRSTCFRPYSIPPPWITADRPKRAWTM